MRTLINLTDVHARIRGLLFEELRRRVASAEKRLPCRCVYNHPHPLDSRDSVEGEPEAGSNRVTSAPGVAASRTIGLCMYGAADPQTWPGNLCEDEIDAQRCPLFKPHQSKNEIAEEYIRQLGDLDWVRDNLPRVYELLWVTGSNLQLYRMPWWVRLWWWLLRIRLEPVRARVDLTQYLPESTEGSDGVHRP
jgi:hypothetical protein